MTDLWVVRFVVGNTSASDDVQCRLVLVLLLQYGLKTRNISLTWGLGRKAESLAPKHLDQNLNFNKIPEFEKPCHAALLSFTVVLEEKLSSLCPSLSHQNSLPVQEIIASIFF